MAKNKVASFFPDTVYINDIFIRDKKRETITQKKQTNT